MGKQRVQSACIQQCSAKLRGICFAATASPAAAAAATAGVALGDVVVGLSFLCRFSCMHICMATRATNVANVI